jgi:diguanylate cyclase (GGDEF)-like protein
MAPGKINILIADDDEGDRRQVKRVLKQTGLSFDCVEVTSIEEAIAACSKDTFDCAIVDYRMPGNSQLIGITALQEKHPHLSIIMTTGQGDETVATEAMKRGVTDYIPKKHIHAQSMTRAIEDAMVKSAERRKLAKQREELEKYACMLEHDLKALEVKANQARIDHLTGLSSRPMFLEQAAHLRILSAATAILFIDLDGFKAINDRLGHSHGDAILVQAANALRSSLRDTDVVGRVGGDEFVVCLAGPAESIEETATKITERIVKTIAEIGNDLGCSVGIALTSTNTVDLDTAIRHADQAMYRAKKAGKNRFVIHGRP